MELNHTSAPSFLRRLLDLLALALETRANRYATGATTHQAFTHKAHH